MLSLRTPVLRAGLAIVEDDQRQGSWDYSSKDPSEVIAVGPYKGSSSVSPDDCDLHRGRILLFYPDETLTDGAARKSSTGFFDSWNLHRWDNGG
jgi:hypothetical protein